MPTLQLYENVGETHNHFFTALAAQPDAIPPLEFTPSGRSFKVLAETPLQGEGSLVAPRLKLLMVA